MSESGLKVEDKNNVQNYIFANGCYLRIPYEFEEKEINQFIQNSRSMAACRLLEKQWEIDKKYLYTGFEDMSEFSSI